MCDSLVLLPSSFSFLWFVVHQAINNTVGTILPSGLQKTLLDGIFNLGRAQLSNFVLNENNPLGSSRLAKVRRIFEEGKSLQLQFPAEDLGFRFDLHFHFHGDSQTQCTVSQDLLHALVLYN